MPTFHPLPPAPEETRAFAVLFLGSLLSLLLLAAFLVWGPREMAVKAIFVGAGAAIVWKLGRAAWDLELKARRAQTMELEPLGEGLKITDEKNQSQIVRWDAIEKAEMRGGRLEIVWPGGNLLIGSREWENGMVLVQEIAQHVAKPQKPVNFIPLEPK